MARPVTPIAYRIAAGYAVLLVFLAMFGAFGIRLINLAAQSTQELHQHPFTVTNALAEVRRRVLVINQSIVEAIAFPDDTRASRLRPEMARLEQIIDENIEIASKYYLGPRADLDSLAGSWRAVRLSVGETVRLIENGDPPGARGHYQSKGKPAFDRAISQTSDMMVFASGRANEFVAESATSKDRLVLLAIATVTGALILGTALATGLTRNLTQSLAALRNTMGELAQGRLDVSVPAAERRDEIGDMARSLEVFKQAAIEKRQTELKFATVFDACPDIIAITDRVTGEFIEINVAFERVLGFSKDEVVGRRSSEIGTWGSIEDRVRLIEALKNAPRLTDFETRFRRRNGELFVALLSAETLRLGDRDCLIIVARDISDRKNEEELLRFSAQELERSNIELERFAYVAAHDLQEPCRTICSYAQLLERKHASSLDESGRELLSYLSGGALRMRDLVQGLLHYSRVGNAAAAFAAVRLDKLLASVQADLAATIAASGAAIEAGPLPVVRGDASQLHQLFINLIGNAIKFQVPGTAPHVVVSATANEGGWQFKVSDNGIGIPKEYVDEVFGIFRRLHGPTQYPGAGIGLAVSKRIVERHGGRIWVEAGADPGTTICFTLPASS